GELLQLGIERVEKDQTITTEQRRHHHREALDVTATRLPRVFHERLHVVCKFGVGQRVEKLVHHRIDRFVHDDVSDRLTFAMQRGTDFNILELTVATDELCFRSEERRV